MACHYRPLTWHATSGHLLHSPHTGERNYHVFYQLLAGASAAELAACRLASGSSFASFRYTRRGEAVSPGMDDAAAWRDLDAKLDGLGFTPVQRGGLHGLVAAVLLLGELDFGEARLSSSERSSSGGAGGGAGGGGAPLVVTTKPLLQQSAALLRVDAAALRKTLTTRDMCVVGERLSTHLSAESCTDARDALAKATCQLALPSHLPC